MLHLFSKKPRRLTAGYLSRGGGGAFASRGILLFVMAPERVLGAELLDLYEKVLKGERLSFEDGVRLYKSPNLTGVGYLANLVR
jgi:hypothetical protein